MRLNANPEGQDRRSYRRRLALWKGPMSALGQKQTCAAQKVMPALPPESGHVQRTSRCPLSKSGLMPCKKVRET